MNQLGGPLQQIIPNAAQAARVIHQLTQAAHHSRHAVSKDEQGIHVVFEEPLDLGSLGPIPNRMADSWCTKAMVEDRNTSLGQIIAYDAKGVVQFRFGHPDAMVLVFNLLKEKRTAI